MFREQRLSITINFGPTKQEVRFIFHTLCLPDLFSLVPFYCFPSGHSYYSSSVKKAGKIISFKYQHARWESENSNKI